MLYYHYTFRRKVFGYNEGRKIMDEFKNEGYPANDQEGQQYSQMPQAAQQPVYQQQYVSNAPVGQLKTNRGLAKFILLSLVTFGIYGIVVMSCVGEDLNVIASRYDGKKTMHYCLLFFLIGPITLEIGTLVWFHKMSNRVGSELQRRNIAFSFSASTFWGWEVLGALIIVGPFIYMHKLFTAMNKLSENYNAMG